ncbi:MAG: phosphomethylpyrimidine synthase ThiC, partial [Halobacteria archaeon]|nr:phosphomethylpyrimidine synthase ThiC [Halobacteria archaeon]
AADVARGNEKAQEWDDELSKARFSFDWERQLDLALDPERAREYHGEANAEENHDPESVKFCSMCGPEFCSMRITQDARETEGEDALAFDEDEQKKPEVVKAEQPARYPNETRKRESDGSVSAKGAEADD